MSLETWAVAGVAIVDVEGSPLLLRTYISPKNVLNSPAAPLHAHLYVGPEDVIKLHFVLFASLDRCEELREARVLRTEVPATETAVATLSTAGQRLPSPSSASATPSVSRSNSALNRNNNTAKPSPPGPSISEGSPSNPPTNTAATVIANDSHAVSSATSAARLISPTTDARFLGKLLESHRMRSYGFCSATGIRTLLVTVGSDAPADAMVPLCRALYESASAALCNPFRSPVQSYHAQEQLLYMSSLTERSDRPGGVTTTSPPDGARGTPAHAPVGGGQSITSLTVGSINRLHLPAGAVEWSWPRAAPTSVASLTAEPTLALSRTFNTQMEGLLSTFTVTARSCIVR
ncbi:hypothetical protein ABB37_09451 [Leptomonas pyrrhocoris]|uniref:Sedlin n=1 Tax=Leptomonas pyrrhocoris TaxID=157538 RepID=A0A0N0VCZ3_LEPPY|nr:hypothetical protein ABB37_09451 [Leptomonas pyrrhocoris]KPA74194.1 hypothetical protein ABB37_09451 [Leptomonas pyrrhocoris]|eukprot:XP_015652633.1 hypothetical protein ABB37_09451 [Leptomonas pyrrhocoris]